jgi:aminopeptidase-like protein
MKNQIGNNIYSLIKKLYPINRSITGDGNRLTLNIIKKIIPELKILEYKSGTKVFDWEIPPEWNVSDAYIEVENKRIVDFKKNNLHLMSYSQPMNKYISLNELKQHLFFYKDMPDAIPYKTSYYKKNWGFCVSYNFFKKLKKKKYKIVINSKFNNRGCLSIGEMLIKGKSKNEILISSNICHPSLVNNELSGPTILTFIAKHLSEKKNFYSYRLLFLPETIGCITYLNKKLKEFKNKFIAGYHLTCFGDNGDFSIVNSKNNNSYSDKIAELMLQTKKNKKKYSFLECGSDERQFNYAGINLPVVALTRSLYGKFKEYHSSNDNLSIANPKSLNDSFNFIKDILEVIEGDYKVFSKTICEPFLSKKNLYRSINNNKTTIDERNMFNVLYYSDGRSISDISLITKINPLEVIKIVNLLKENNILLLKR